MNYPVRMIALAFASIALASGGLAAGAPTPAPAAPVHDTPAKHPAPVLRVDDTPLGGNRSGGPVLSYADVLEPVQKAVVSVYSTKIVRDANPLLRQLFPNLPARESRQQGLGSGVIVTPNGYILTNNHVVDDAEELKVALADDREFTAKIVGTDPKTDVAVIKIEADQLPVVTLADSDRLRVGDVVFAVGNPLDVGQTVTMGIVSAKNRNVRILEDVGGYEDFIQTDAAINLGNSGGALVDARGRLIGINSVILSPSRGSIGIGFAIPINLAAGIMKSLVETGTVARGYLGVTSETLTPELVGKLGLAKDTKGVIVSDIVPNSAADRAGLKAADVILAVNGHPISALDEMRLVIAQLPPGSRASLRVVRDGEERPVEVTLDKFIDRPDELIAGVTVKTLTADDRQRLHLDPRVAGLLITALTADSPYRDGLAANAVIMEINRTPVREIEEARHLLRPGRNLLYLFYGDAAHYVVIRKLAEPEDR